MEKHNFKNGDVLQASALNEIDVAIANLGTYSYDEVAIGKFLDKTLYRKVTTEKAFGTTTTPFVPNMTSTNTPSPYVVTTTLDEGDGRFAWKLFADRTISTDEEPVKSGESWIIFDCGANNSKAFTDIALTSNRVSDVANFAKNCYPKEWKVEASNNGEDWTTLKSITNDYTTGVGVKKSYSLGNEAKFRYYKITFQSYNGGSYLRINHIDFTEAPKCLIDDVDVIVNSIEKENQFYVYEYTKTTD